MPQFVPWLLNKMDRYIRKNVDQKLTASQSRRDNLYLSQQIVATHTIGSYDETKGQVSLANGETKTAIVAGDPASIDTVLIYPNSESALIVHPMIRQQLYSSGTDVLLIEKGNTPDVNGQYVYHIKVLGDDSQVWAIDTYGISGATMVPFENKIDVVAFSPDGKSLFVGARESDVVNTPNITTFKWGYYSSFTLAVVSGTPTIQGTVTRGSLTIDTNNFDRVDVPPKPSKCPNLTSAVDTTASNPDHSTVSNAVFRYQEVISALLTNVAINGDNKGFLDYVVWVLWNDASSNGALKVDVIGNYTDQKVDTTVFVIDDSQITTLNRDIFSYTEGPGCFSPGTTHDFFVSTHISSGADYTLTVPGGPTMTFESACTFDQTKDGCLAADTFGPGCPSFDLPLDIFGNPVCDSEVHLSSDTSFSTVANATTCLAGNFSALGMSSCIDNSSPPDQYRAWYAKNKNTGIGVFSIQDLEGGASITSSITKTFERREVPVKTQITPDPTTTYDQVLYQVQSTTSGVDFGTIFQAFKSSAGHSASLSNRGGVYQYNKPYLTKDHDLSGAPKTITDNDSDAFVPNFPGNTSAALVLSRDSEIFETLEHGSGNSVEVKQVTQDAVTSTIFSTSEDETGNQSTLSDWDVIDFTTRRG